LAIRISRRGAYAAARRLGASLENGGKHTIVRFNGQQCIISREGQHEKSLPPIEAKRLSRLLGMTVIEFKKA